MIKPAVVAMTGLFSVFTSTAAIAIAPGVDKIAACGNFTANKYGVAGNQVTVKITKTTPFGVYLDWRVQPYSSSGYCFVTNSNRTTQWVVERGPRPENIAGSNVGPNQAEQACLNKARQMGYQVYSQTAAQKGGSFYFMDLEGKTSNGKQYSFTCRYNIASRTASLENIKPVASGTAYPNGYSSQMFYGIPGYESGLRVKNTGYQDISPKRRNFLVKNDVSSIDFRWYADCTTQDQVYDGQKYLGYNANARALMAYACSLPPTNPGRPQPR
jgi:hypothetical protein